MTKRPSLADSMRQVVQDDPLPAVAAPHPARPSREAAAPQPAEEGKPTSGFYAATRAGKKKVTAALTPGMHKTLKGLALAQDTTTEALILEAIGDLLTKHSTHGPA